MVIKLNFKPQVETIERVCRPEFCQDKYVVGIATTDLRMKKDWRRFVMIRENFEVTYRYWTYPNKGKIKMSVYGFTPLKELTKEQYEKHYEDKTGALHDS